MHPLLKFVHVVGATWFFGTGLGIAFFKFRADRWGGLPAIHSA
jgi:uncharacterized membrane protein